MSKRALIVGINHYDNVGSLSACVRDALAIEQVLARNADGGLNFECRVLTSPGPETISRGLLRQQWRELFSGL